MLVLVPRRSSHCIALLASLLLLVAPIRVLGLSVPTAERTVVLLLHKPPNVVTSHVSHDERSTVYDHVQDMTAHVANDSQHASYSFQEFTQIKSKLHAIGRLDADTTGLILLTNDGGLVHHVTNKNAASLQGKSVGIYKTYQALVMGHHTEDSLSIFWEGVNIGTKYGGMTQPVDDLKILDHPTHKSTLVELTISEGKNRQVRRMFHSIGSGVMQLKRVAIGSGGGTSYDNDDDDSLTVEGLQEGQWRILSEMEVKKVLKWEPKEIVQDKPIAKARRGSNSKGKSGSSPKGRRSSSSSERPRRGRPSAKRRRTSERRGTNGSKTQR